MSIVNGGSRILEEKGLMVKASDKLRSHNACVESIVLDGYVSLVESKLTSGDAAATCTRSLKVLTADKISTAHNLSRALDIVTCATAGEAIDFRIGDSLEIGGSAAGIVTEIIDNTNVRVNASGTIGAGAGTYQRALFRNVYPGATLVLATGTTTVYVESKTSDFVIVTTTSGTIATGLLTSYTNVSSIIKYREDALHGDIYGIAMDSYTFGTTYDATVCKTISVKVFGDYDKSLATTYNNTTAANVPSSVHDKARLAGLYHSNSIREF